MSKPVLTLPALYKDNSLYKEKLKKKQFQSKRLKLEHQLIEKKKDVKKINILVKKEQKKSMIIARIQNYISESTALLEKMNVAATTIQRKYKEIKQERQIRSFQVMENEEKLQKKLDLLLDYSTDIFWNLGSAATDASNKIKAAYKRSKFREKIFRIKKTFKILSKNKRSLSRSTLRRSFRIFGCKLFLENLKILIQEQKKAEKLIQIRRNLSILTIKKHWILSKMSFRKFIYRCKKYKKRMLRTNFGRFLSADDHLNSSFSSYISTPRNEPEIPQEPLIDTRAAHIAALKLLKEKQLRLESSKISYNIKKFKEKMLSPMNLAIINEVSKPQLSSRKNQVPRVSRVLSRNIEPNIIPKRSMASSKTISCTQQADLPFRSIDSLSAKSTTNPTKLF